MIDAGGKATAVVFAFNEEKLIGSVLDSLNHAKEHGLIHEVLVVNDCSTDATEYIARQKGATVVSNKKNMGKAYSFFVAATHCKHNGSKFLLMFDADISGPSPAQIEKNAFAFSA